MAAGPAIGERIGDYRVLAKLGEGGMGVVYLAEDVRLGRKVALKALARDYAGDPERRKRFLNEARAAAALSHPGVAAVYELEERGDDVFIIFEYVEGKNLRALVETGGAGLSELLEIALQVAQALEAAHAKGIVHRDLKPENVMLRRGAGDAPEVKILDFGLARFDSGVFGGATTQSFGLTQAGTVMGTVGYMSPEQLGGKPADFRSDIFSFGVLLYELATGTHPFAGDTPASTIANVMMQEPPPLTAANALHPPELERIVRKCLRKARDDRYQSTRELVVDLKNLKRDSGESQIVTGPLASVAAGTVAATGGTGVAPPPERTRGWWRLCMAGAAAAAPALVWLAWVMKDWAPEPMGLTLFFGVVACVAVAVSLRVLLLTAAVWTPDALPQQARLTAPWLMLANVATSLMLLGLAVNVYTQHVAFAAVVVFAAIGGLLLSVIIEPTMLRRAFPEAQVLEPGPLSPMKHVAGIQWVFLLLLASPLVNFALGSKTADALMTQFSAWSLLVRIATGALALVAYGGAIFAAVWSGDAWQGKPEAARWLRRWFPLFLAFDYAAIGVWTLWLALGKTTPRPLFFLVFLFVYLPFHQLRLARTVPGSEVVEAPATPAAGERNGRKLALIQGAFAVPFPLLIWLAAQALMTGELYRAGMSTLQARLLAGGMAAFGVAGLLISGASALEFWRAPEAAAQRFRRFFFGYAVVNLASGWMWAAAVAGVANDISRDTPFIFVAMITLPAVSLWTTFHERRLARELAPPEPAGSRRDPGALVLAAVQGVFALLYAGMGVALSQVIPDLLSGTMQMPHAQGFIDVAAVVVVAGFFVCAASAVGFITRPREAARQFVRFFPGFAAANLWAGFWASLISVPLLKSLLLMFILPIAAVSATFYERRLARELAPPEPALPRDRRASTLAGIHGLFAVLFAVLSVFTTDLMRRIFVEPGWETHHQVVAVVRASLAVIGFLLSAGFAAQALRSPASSSRRFVQFFPALLLLNVLGGLLAGILSAVFLGSYLLAVVLPIAIVPVSFYARSLARELAPPEPATATARSALLRPQAWWWANNWFLMAGYLGLPFMAWFARNNCVEWWQTGPNNLAFAALLICVIVPMSLRVILAEVGGFTPQELPAKVRAFRPALRFFASSHAALLALMAFELTVARFPLLVPLLLMMAAGVLVYAFVFEPIVERAAFPSSYDPPAAKVE